MPARSMSTPMKMANTHATEERCFVSHGLSCARAWLVVPAVGGGRVSEVSVCARGRRECSPRESE